MKYHSRSPEEWRKIDEEKRKFDRVPQLRRRSWIYFFVNILLVGAVMIMIGIFKLKSSTPFSVYVKMNDEYTAGEKIFTQIRLVNSRGKELKIIISDVSIEVVDESGSSVHTQEIHPDLSVEIPPYDYVLLMKDTFSVSNPGKYEYAASIDTNIGKYRFVKNFIVKYDLNLTFSGYHPYYFPGESPEYDIVISNNTLESVDVVVSPGEVYITKNEKYLDRRSIPGFEGVVPPKSSRLIFHYQPAVNFMEKGLYMVGVQAMINGKMRKTELPFMVISKRDVSMKNISILFDYYRVAEGIEAKLFLVNASNKNRFFEVKSAVLIVYSSNGEESESVKNLRVWIPPNGKIELMSKVFNIEDLKGMRAIVEGDEKTLTKEIGGGWK